MTVTKPAWLPPVLESMPVAIVAFDASGRVVGVSPLVEEIFALGAQGAGLSHLDGMLPPPVAESVRKVLSGDSEVEQGELRFHDKRFAYTAAWARGHRDAPAVLLSVQPLPTVDAGADFLSIASHELKTPLTAIKGGTQLLQRRVVRSEGVLSERDLKLLDLVADQVDRLAEMVDALLETSRLSAGRVELVADAQSLEELIGEAVEAFKRRGVPNPVSLELAPLVPAVRGDRRRVLQVLDVLLRNAAVYSAPEQPIRVTLRREGASPSVAVEDSGEGVSPEDRPHVFERFYRGANARDGLGLGLYIAAELVRLHGGRIWLESEPGQGSTFAFTLPAA